MENGVRPCRYPTNLATLSAYDGVLLGSFPYSYNAAVLTSYVNSGHSVYITGGTGTPNEDSIWDLFTHQYGLDFGPSYNGIAGDEFMRSRTLTCLLIGSTLVVMGCEKAEDQP